MRIAISNNFFPPRVGGSAHMAQSLAEKFTAEGHEVIVLTAAYKDAPAEEEVNGYKVYRLPAFGMPKLGLSIDFDITFASRPSNLRKIFKILDEFKPDVLHQHGQFLDMSWLTGWYARRRKLPVLLSIHTRLESGNKLYAFVFKMLDRFLVRPILSLFKPRYVIMDEMAESYCQERYDSPKANFDYIPVAVNVEHIHAEPTFDAREKHGLGDAPVLLSLGHVIPLRDRIALVKSLPKVLEQHPDLKVLVVGHVYHDAFLKLADELGVRHAIVTAGAVSKSDVPSYFAAADAVAHDLQGIGCGTASLEAMAAGKPTVVAVRETNFPWVKLRNWDNALLISAENEVELAEMLIRLFHNKEERESIGKKQQDVVLRDFTLTAVRDKHLSVFEKMLVNLPVDKN